MSESFVYRLICAADWRDAVREGVVGWSDHDRRDGFMHLSTRRQALATARRYFAGSRDMLALEIDAAALGAALKFEPVASRNGEAFPHLYAPLAATVVARAIPLAALPGGDFAFEIP